MTQKAILSICDTCYWRGCCQDAPLCGDEVCEHYFALVEDDQQTELCYVDDCKERQDYYMRGVFNRKTDL